MKFWFQNSPYFPSYVKNWPSYGTKRKDNFNIGPAFTHFYLLKMKLHNPVCLTFCVVTWSIFHIGRKVRWVLKSKFHGLSNGYQKFLCTCSRTRENNKNKVKSDLWDTLYVHHHHIEILLNTEKKYRLLFCPSKSVEVRDPLYSC